MSGKGGGKPKAMIPWRPNEELADEVFREDVNKRLAALVAIVDRALPDGMSGATLRARAIAKGKLVDFAAALSYARDMAAAEAAGNVDD